MSLPAALLSDTTVQTLGAVLGAAVLFCLRHFRKEKAAADEARFSKGVEIAYAVVNEASRLTKLPAAEKTAMGLQALQNYLATHGQDVSEAELTRARMLFTAMHGKESK